MSAMHEPQTIVISKTICRSTQPVPKLVPKPVAKMAAQSVIDATGCSRSTILKISKRAAAEA